MHCETEDAIELPILFPLPPNPAARMRACVFACICVQGRMSPVGFFLDGVPPSEIGVLPDPGAHCFSEGLTGEPQEFS